jgi:hypothetical protein
MRQEMIASANAPSSIDRFHRFVFHFGHRVRAHGFDIRALLPDRQERLRLFPKVADALQLIGTHDQRRFAYLKRDLPRIWVVGLPAAIASCHAKIGLCALDFDYVVDPATSAGQVAQTLVHEGAHARLARAGIASDETRRPRIERICIRQEIALARLLPGGTDLVVASESRLQYPDAFYATRAYRERELAELRDLGVLGRAAYHVARALRRDAV